MKLRPYQNQCLREVQAELRKYRAVCLVSPTGSGKTVLFSKVARDMGVTQNKSVLILVHRQELLKQASNKLIDFGVPHGLIWKQQPMTRSPVQIASVQTLVRRLHKLPPPHLIIVDEAQHSCAGSWMTVLNNYPMAKILGVTATPERTDGVGLGSVFQSLVLGPNVRELIDQGYLSDYRCYVPPTKVDLSHLHIRAGDYAKDELSVEMDRPSITGDAVEHYKKLAPNSLAVVFGVSIEHCRHIATEFCTNDVPAASIDGGMDDVTRARILKEFAERKILVLVSCDLVSEGFDLPAVETAILLRPTKSMGLYLQQIGRILRPMPGKIATIIDACGNVMLHGLPDQEREWSLEGARKQKRDAEPALAVTVCEKCYATYKPSLTECPLCGAVREVKAREIEQIDGELIELTPEMRKVMRRQEELLCTHRQELVDLAYSRGYKNPELWADGRMRYRRMRA